MAPDIASNQIILLLLFKEKWILMLSCAFTKGIKSSANCLCVEIYPHCIYADESLSHAAAGNQLETELHGDQWLLQQGRPPELQYPGSGTAKGGTQCELICGIPCRK